MAGSREKALWSYSVFGGYAASCKRALQNARCASGAAETEKPLRRARRAAGSGAKQPRTAFGDLPDRFWEGRSTRARARARARPAGRPAARPAAPPPPPPPPPAGPRTPQTHVR